MMGTGPPLAEGMGKPTVREVELAERVAALEAEVLAVKTRCLELSDENDKWQQEVEPGAHGRSCFRQFRQR